MRQLLAQNQAHLQQLLAHSTDVALQSQIGQRSGASNTAAAGSRPGNDQQEAQDFASRRGIKASCMSHRRWVSSIAASNERGLACGHLREVQDLALLIGSEVLGVALQGLGGRNGARLPRSTCGVAAACAKAWPARAWVLSQGWVCGGGCGPEAPAPASVQQAHACTRQCALAGACKCVLHWSHVQWHGGTLPRTVQALSHAVQMRPSTHKLDLAPLRTLARMFCHAHGISSKNRAWRCKHPLHACVCMRACVCAHAV